MKKEAQNNYPIHDLIAARWSPRALSECQAPYTTPVSPPRTKKHEARPAWPRSIASQRG